MKFEPCLGEIGSSLDYEVQEFVGSCDSAYCNIFFIGNSIKWHPLAGYCWSNQRGMAVSANDLDCVHLLTPGFNGHLPDFRFNATGDIKSCQLISVVGETLPSDKDEVYPQNDKTFARGETIDFVFLQLGENGQDTTNFSSDYSDEKSHIVEMVPNASITTIGDCRKNDNNDTTKKTVIKSKDVDYVNLDAIQDSPDNKAGVGAEVEGDASSKYVIDHEDVANHPDDFGMRRIANSILSAVFGE